MKVLARLPVGGEFFEKGGFANVPSMDILTVFETDSECLDMGLSWRRSVCRDSDHHHVHANSGTRHLVFVVSLARLSRALHLAPRVHTSLPAKPRAFWHTLVARFFLSRNSYGVTFLCLLLR